MVKVALRMLKVVFIGNDKSILGMVKIYWEW